MTAVVERRAVDALTCAVDAVVSVPLEPLFPCQVQDLIADLAPQVQRLTGYLALATAALQTATGGTLPTDDGGSRTTVGWVAEATRSDASSAGRVARAGADVSSLPAVAQALLDGTITWVHAQVLARLVGKVAHERLLEAQASLVRMATLLDPVELGVYVRHLIASWCEPALEADAAAATARRVWQARDNHDGTIAGRFVLAAEAYETVAAVLEPLARRAGETDDRSAGQRRADALVEACEQLLRHGDLPDAGGQRPQLTYVLPADWAARRAEHASCPSCSFCAQHRPPSFTDMVDAGLPASAPAAEDSASHAGRGPASLPPASRPSAAVLTPAALPASHGCATAAWTGPQTRARIETLLCDARITRVLLTSLGQVKGLEALTDTVTASQRRALAARDLGCAARGCTRPPAMTDAHHLVARADGGPTTIANLVLLCRRHHVLWHLGKLGLDDLHVPWLTGTTGTGHDPPRE